jgi:hypothetical protein
MISILQGEDMGMPCRLRAAIPDGPNQPVCLFGQARVIACFRASPPPAAKGKTSVASRPLFPGEEGSSVAAQGSL